MPKRHLKDAGPFLPKGEPKNLDRSGTPAPKASPGIKEFAPATGTRVSQTTEKPVVLTLGERAAVKAPNPPRSR